MEDSGFSGVVRLSNVSDFIAPNLDCIIPLETRTTREVPSKPAPSEVSIHKKRVPREPKPAPTVPTKPSEDKKSSIKISLADCLACNGCITSAETVLVEEQSFQRLLEGVTSSKFSIVTISPQAITSIAVKLQKTSEDVARWISRFFKKHGVNAVVDSSFARIFAHSMVFEEFLETFESSEDSGASTSSKKPLLSSACPGFVCYAEKSHGELLIPRVSKIRSPQAISGALVKNFLAGREGLSPCDVFHAAVMPCFDKKLEASREQFKVAGTEIRETDCVVSTAELLEELLKSSDFDEETSEDVPEISWLNALEHGVVIGEDGGTSGGYAERIVRDFVKTRGEGEVKTEKLNKNMYSTTVSSPSGEILLRVAKVYGFRNVQNLVRKLKTKKEKTDYVEIMACPGGCGNGGGQVRYETIGEREEKLQKVEEMYENLPKLKFQRNFEKEVEKIKKEWAEIDGSWKKYLFTDYKIVETNVAQALKW